MAGWQTDRNYSGVLTLYKRNYMVSLYIPSTLSPNHPTQPFFPHSPSSSNTLYKKKAHIRDYLQDRNSDRLTFSRAPQEQGTFFLGPPTPSQACLWSRSLTSSAKRSIFLELTLFLQHGEDKTRLPSNSAPGWTLRPCRADREYRHSISEITWKSGPHTHTKKNSAQIPIQIQNTEYYSI